MKKIRITLILLLSSYIVNAQSNFEKHISVDSSRAFWNFVKVKANKDISVFGINDWDYQCFFMLDSNGNMKWSHRFEHFNYSLQYIHDYTFTNDEGFMFTGGIPDTSGKLALGLLRFDSTGNIKWCKRHYFYRSDWGVSILPRANGKFTICAGTAKAFDSTSYGAIHFLIIDSLGNILKSKRIAKDSANFTPTSMIAVGSNFIIGGTVVLAPLQPGCFLMKVDNTGNILKTKFIGAYSNQGKGLIKTHDNKILFSYGDNLTGWALMKLDENLDIIWCKKIVPSGILPYIAESPDSNYLMLGAGTKAVGCKMDTAGNVISGFRINYLNSSYGIGISSYGNKIFIHALATLGGQLNESIFLTTDNNFSASCTVNPMTFSTIPKLEYDSLISINYFSNYLPLLQDSIYIADSTLNYFIEDLCAPNIVEETTPVSELQIFPNPTNSILNLFLQDKKKIIITNLLGEIVLQKTAEGKVELDVSFLSAGIYFVKAGNEVRKFVKE